MNELRRKMLEELQLRNYSPHTQRAYIRCVADFAMHFKVAPDQLGPEHVREYQLFLVQKKKALMVAIQSGCMRTPFFLPQRPASELDDPIYSLSAPRAEATCCPEPSLR
jgi:integrase/recombinase XerD